MSRRRVQRVPVRLDPKGTRSLPIEELRTILRGADAMIFRGGRSLLVNVLRGSRAKAVLDNGLDQSPVYGRFRELSTEEVLARIDWTIKNGYLAIEYDRRLPLLVFTDRGWEIERETMVDELLSEFDATLAGTAAPFDVATLKDRNRGMIMILLDKIEAGADPKYIPLLESWRAIDYKKVRLRIKQVIANLNRGQP